MIISIDTSAATPVVSLNEPEDFTGFSVLAIGPETGFPEAVTQVGRRDGEHVFVTQAALIELAGALGEDAAWREQLAGMLAYAESKGWLDDTGAIQAHVERA